jgi:hypothetical protein
VPQTRERFLREMIAAIVGGNFGHYVL